MNDEETRKDTQNLAQLRKHYFKPGEAAQELGMTRDAFNHYVNVGLIKAHKLLGSHRYFLKSEIRTLKQKLNAAIPKILEKDLAVFMKATPEDMPEVYRIAAKLFQSVIPISAETRQAWMRTEPQGHYVVKRKDGTVVAYVHFLALPDDLIERYMRGEIYGKQLTEHDILPLAPGRPTSCIVPSIASDPDIPDELRSNYMGILLRGISKDLIELGKQGIIIERLYAWTHWNSGIEICAKMGMEPWSPPVKKPNETRRYNYWLDVLNSPTPLLQGYQRALREWQASHSPPAPGAPLKEVKQQPQVHPVSSAMRSLASTDTTEKTTLPTPADLPEGTLHIQDFMKRHNIDKGKRRKLTGYLAEPGNGLEYARFPKTNKPSETDWFLTPTQQQAFLSWLEKHHPEVFS